jgi:hypothetical protein
MRKPKGKYIQKVLPNGKDARIQDVAVDESQSRLDKFMFEYDRNGGDATAAVMAAFNVPRQTALGMGGMYLSRAKQLGIVRSMVEKKLPLDKLINLLIDKAYASDNPAFLDRLIKALGFEPEILPTPQKVNAGPGVVNIIQTQKNLQSEFGFAEEGQVVKEKGE